MKVIQNKRERISKTELLVRGTFKKSTVVFYLVDNLGFGLGSQGLSVIPLSQETGQQVMGPEFRR